MNIAKFIDWLVPRFLTEEVGCIQDEEDGEYAIPMMPMKQWDECYEEDPYCVATITCFNLFGWGLFPRMVGEAVLYSDWKEAQR